MKMYQRESMPKILRETPAMEVAVPSLERKFLMGMMSK